MAFYVPTVGDQVPMRGNAVLRAFGRTLLRLGGGRFEGTIPNIPKMMIIVAPHTSNWDFVVGVSAKFALGIRASFLGKDTLFRGPLGVFMRWLGGIPVYRHAPRNVVEATVAHVSAHDRIVLVLSPEGTRKKLPAWRTGFHYVAVGAGLPILPAALDFSTRTVRFFPLYHPTERAEDNLAALGALYDARMAYRPEQY